MSMISPCYKCKNRKVTADYNCHSDCDRYITWKAEVNAKRQEEYIQAVANQIATSYRRNVYKKLLRKIHIHPDRR